MQKLILPINHCKLTASMNIAMSDDHDWDRWGAELISATGNRRVYASGSGTVIAVTPLGTQDKAVTIWYPQALHWPSGAVADVVFCYYHLKYVWVKRDDPVTKDTAIGLYGAPSAPGGGRLYLEALASRQGQGGPCSGDSLRGGIPAGPRVNPLEWLHCKKSGPDLQTYQTAEDRSVALVDRAIPEYDSLK